MPSSELPGDKFKTSTATYRRERGGLVKVAEILVRMADGTFGKRTVRVGKVPKKQKRLERRRRRT